MVVRQGGDAAVIESPERLPHARRRRAIDAPRSGYVARVDAEAIGRAGVLLGAGRARVDASIDPAAGITVIKKPGDAVMRGEHMLELHYNDEGQLAEAVDLAASAVELSAMAPAPSPLVLAWVHAEGESRYV
jgi:pyrimidine-nucleoside phosphorylase